HLDEIPVQVIVQGIAAETVFQGPVLVHPAGGVPVQGTSYIIDGDGDQYSVFWGGDGLGDQIPVEHHGGVHPIGLPGMDPVVDQDDGLVLSDVFEVEIPLGIEGHHVQGLSRIRFAY